MIEKNPRGLKYRATVLFLIESGNLQPGAHGLATSRRRRRLMRRGMLVRTSRDSAAPSTRTRPGPSRPTHTLTPSTWAAIGPKSPILRWVAIVKIVS